MADYGGQGGGRSLREALNYAYPMTGLGEYTAQFPPQTGANMPSGPVPIPSMTQQAPPLSRPPVFAPPNIPNAPPGVMERPPLSVPPMGPGPAPPPGGERPPVFAPQGPMPPPPQFRPPVFSGQYTQPVGQNAALQVAGQYTSPYDFAARARYLQAF